MAIHDQPTNRLTRGNTSSWLPDCAAAYRTEPSAQVPQRPPSPSWRPSEGLGAADRRQSLPRPWKPKDSWSGSRASATSSSARPARSAVAQLSSHRYQSSPNCCMPRA